MSEFKVLLKKEVRSLDLKKYFIIILLLLFMLFSFMISRLGKLEIYLGLDEDGLGNLIKALLRSTRGKEAFMSQILWNTMIFPTIIMSFYLGFPYLLSFYQNNKVNGSLVYLMTVPSRINILVLGVSVFGYLKCIISVLSIQIVTIFILFIYTQELLITLELLLVAALFQIVVFSLYVLINSLIWIFNGSKVIINILRILMLIGLILVMPVVKFIPFSEIKLSLWMFIISFLSIILIIGSGFLVRYFFSKEKLILNS